MNKAFEKIISQIGELANYNGNAYLDSADVIEIVQEVAEEYNGGWIPCSERLPEIDGNTSDTVLVCGSNGFLYMAFWCDDLQWRFCECGMAKEPVLWTEIVAWQSLPEHFKENKLNYK